MRKLVELHERCGQQRRRWRGQRLTAGARAGRSAPSAGLRSKVRQGRQFCRAFARWSFCVVGRARARRGARGGGHTVSVALLQDVDAEIQRLVAHCWRRGRVGAGRGRGLGAAVAKPRLSPDQLAVGGALGGRGLQPYRRRRDMAQSRYLAAVTSILNVGIRVLSPAPPPVRQVCYSSVSPRHRQR
eukprot:SAG31_NODE_198_length_20656_cov_5.167291_5_plen_186_part_00